MRVSRPREHAHENAGRNARSLAFREKPAFARRQGVYGSTPVPSGLTL